MFTKTALFAALLLVGGSAASAAEIGVRSSYGTSFRTITNGRFESRGVTVQGWVEESAGVSLGAEEYNRFSENGTESTNIVQAERPSYYNSEYDNDSGKFSSPFGPSRYSNDSSETTVVRPTATDETFSYESEDVSGFRAGGSAYVRTLVGASVDGYRESYDFSGGSSQTFSELSTFSR